MLSWSAIQQVFIIAAIPSFSSTMLSKEPINIVCSGAIRQTLPMYQQQPTSSRKQWFFHIKTSCENMQLLLLQAKWHISCSCFVWSRVHADFYTVCLAKHFAYNVNKFYKHWFWWGFAQKMALVPIQLQRLTLQPSLYMSDSDWLFTCRTSWFWLTA